jgi:hypothetical protein
LLFVLFLTAIGFFLGDCDGDCGDFLIAILFSDLIAFTGSLFAIEVDDFGGCDVGGLLPFSIRSGLLSVADSVLVNGDGLD